MKNESFFVEHGPLRVGTQSDTTINDFKPFASALPDLDGYSRNGSGSDGVVFVDYCQGRILKLGSLGKWREENWNSHMSNVKDAFQLIDRLNRMLSHKSKCIPEVYEAKALTEKLYFIVMEFLPGKPSFAMTGWAKIIGESHQETGRLELSQSAFEEMFPKWKTFVKEYWALQKLGFSHRDFHSNNVRVDSEDNPKFIDLESFVFYLREDMDKDKDAANEAAA